MSIMYTGRIFRAMLPSQVNISNVLLKLHHVGLLIFRKFHISVNLWKISGNIRKSLEIVTSIIFIRIG